MAGYVANNQEDAAATLGIDSRTLQRWIKSGCPGQSRKYDIRAIIEWARENKWGDPDQVLLDSVDGASDIKERLLKERADKLANENRLLELRLAKEKGSLIDYDEIRSLLLRSAVFYRNACADLERRFGTDAADLLRNAISESRKLVGPNDDEGASPKESQ